MLKAFFELLEILLQIEQKIDMLIHFVIEKEIVIVQIQTKHIRDHIGKKT